jgi:hypothetical protein
VREEGESKSPDFKPGDLIYADLEAQVENRLKYIWINVWLKGGL